MKPQFNSEQLIENIKYSCSVPTSQLTYTETDFVKIATRCLDTLVVPLMMSAREEYFVEYVDVTTPASGIIDFPANAVGAKLRSVCFVQQSSPLVLVNLPRINLDVVAGVGFFNFSTLAGFYIQGNSIHLYPNTAVPQNTNLRLYFYRRVLALAAPENYGRITSIDTGTNTIILDNLPTDWEVGSVLNAVSAEPNFEITNPSLTITAISNPSVVLDSVTDLSVGDYVSFEGYSAIPQIPIEAMNYLAQVSAVDCLLGLGDNEGAKAAQAKADILKDNLMIMITQRVDGSPKKLMNPNGGMRLWATGGSWRRRGAWGF